MPRRAAAMLLASIMAGATAAEIDLDAGSPLSRQPAVERSAIARQRLASVPTVAWPGPRMTLADAVAALAADGEPISLADGVDAGRTVELGTGDERDWWHAVLALCAAAGLDLQPGAASSAGTDALRLAMQSGGEGTPLLVDSGPVVLVERDPARPPPRRIVCGAALIEAPTIAVGERTGDQPRRWLDVAMRVRIAPRLAGEAIGDCSLSWSIDGAQPDDARLSCDATGGDLARIAVDDPERHAHGTSLRLAGTLTVAVVEPLAMRVALRPGDRARLATAAGEVDLRLVDADQAKAEGRQSAGALIDYPTEALAREPQLAVTVAGKALTARGTAMKSGGARSERMLYLADLADAEHQVALDSALPIAVLAVPLRLDVDLAALPAGDAPAAAPYDRPTSIAWEAGERTVAEAVRLLDVDGNDVVLELGIDEGRRAALPAFRGSFWEAAAAVCAAFDLAIEPVAPTEPHEAAETRARVLRRFNGRVLVGRGNGWRVREAFDESNGAAAAVACGAVRLGPGDDRASAPQTAGLVLADATRVAATTVRALDGVHRSVRAAIRLRLEPRIAREMVAEASIIWASQAEDQDGRALDVRASAGDPDGDANQAAAAVDGLAVEVQGLAPTSRRARLRGLLRLDLRRPVRHELRMAAGDSRVVAIGADTITVTLLGGGGGDDRPGLRLIGATALDEIEATVRETDGTVKNSNNRSSSRVNGQTQEQTWYFDRLGDGVHRVEVVSHESLANPCLPISVAIDVPADRPAP